jgi:hypothetical protein
VVYPPEAKPSIQICELQAGIRQGARRPAHDSLGKQELNLEIAAQTLGLVTAIIDYFSHTGRVTPPRSGYVNGLLNLPDRLDIVRQAGNLAP